MKYLLCLAVTALVVSCSTTQTPATLNSGSKQFEPLSELIRESKLASQLPSGTAVIVIQGDEIIYEQYFGYADIARATKVDENSAFYIASSTKPFFALSTLMLEHEGRADTSESLNKLFPDLNFAEITAEKITAKELLSHTMGIKNDSLVFATAYSGIHDLQTRNALIENSELNTKSPYGQFAYDNIGYNIYSVWMDEHFAGGWQQVLKEQVFEPLGLTHTSAIVSEAAEKNWTIALPYSYANKNILEPSYLRKQDNTMHAAGGMLASARDLAKLVLVELNQGKLDGKQIFPAEVIHKSQQSLATMDQSYFDFKRDSYAWGWFGGNYLNEYTLHHFGGFTGSHAHISFMPDKKIGLVVLANEDFLSTKLTRIIAEYVYSQLLSADAPNAVSASKQEQLRIQHAQNLWDADMANAIEIRGKILEGQANRAEKPWLLSLDRNNYLGSYAHPVLGAIEIAQNEDHSIEVSWGNLRAIATAYSDKNSLRVELVPHKGQVIRFFVEDSKVNSLNYIGEEFVRQ